MPFFALITRSGEMGIEGALFSGEVAWVYDGDTIRVKGAGKIRIWGLDAPELPSIAGKESADALRKLAAGRIAHCEKMGRDHFGRIVARCWIRERDVVRAMIADGYAREMCYFTKNAYGGC